MIRPVIPIVRDAVSHAFALSYHLATVHALYGSHHLEKELDDSSTDGTKKNTCLKSEDPTDLHLSAPESLYYLQVCQVNSFALAPISHLARIFQPILAQPPKFS
jgi:hypothetical protein